MRVVIVLVVKILLSLHGHKLLAGALTFSVGGSAHLPRAIRAIEMLVDDVDARRVVRRVGHLRTWKGRQGVPTVHMQSQQRGWCRFTREARRCVREGSASPLVGVVGNRPS